MNKITEIKDILEGINSRLDNTKEQIINLEDIVVEIPKLNREMKKEFYKMRIV